jgi:hypothetical protein
MTIHLATADDEIRACFPVMAQLRPHLMEEEFVGRVWRRRGRGIGSPGDSRCWLLAGAFRLCEVVRRVYRRFVLTDRRLSMRARLQFVLAASAVVVTATPVSAALVSYNFSGTISQVNDTAAPTGNVGGITIGDTFFGSFQFETNDAGPDLDADPSRGLYFPTGSVVSSITATIDGLTFVAGPGAVDIRNNVVSTLGPNTDLLNYTGGAVDTFPAGWSTTTPLASSLQIAFADASGLTLPNDALVTSFDPSQWDAAQVGLSFSNVSFPGGTDTNVSIIGDVNLTPAAVPEPSSAALLAIAGLVGAGVHRFRRRKAG